MEYIEITLLIAAWLFTLIWMYGVRIRPVIVTTSLVSLLILILTTAFTFFDILKYHLLWAIPLTLFAGTHIFIFIVVHVPILNTFVIAIGKVYTEILRIGLSKKVRHEMLQEYKEEIAEMLQKKQEEINENEKQKS